MGSKNDVYIKKKILDAGIMSGIVLPLNQNVPTLHTVNVQCSVLIFIQNQSAVLLYREKKTVI